MTVSLSPCGAICELEYRALLPDPDSAADFCRLLQSSARQQGFRSIEELVESVPQLRAACAELLPYGSGRPIDWIPLAGDIRSDLSPICQTHAALNPFWTAMGGVVVILWFATFFLIIRKAQQDRCYGVPVLPLCVMWGYEACYSLFYSYDGTLVLDSLELLWFALDSVLLIQLFRFYQPEQAPEPWRRSGFLQRHHKLGFIWVALACVGGHYALISYYDAGPNLAYAVNFILSMSFLRFVLGRSNLAGISIAALYTRGCADLLTLVTTLSGFPFQTRFAGLCERSPANPVAFFLLLMTVIIDAVVIFGLLRRS